jgi:hypothetical protein
MCNTLIAVRTCKKYTHRVEVQKATWIPEVVAAGFEVQIFDGDRLGIPDEYRYNAMKMQAIHRWTLAHGYKRLFKVDDDTYVCARNLKIVNDDYAGILTRANHGGYSFCPAPPQGSVEFDYAQGGVYWMSERSMRILACASFRISDNPLYEETCFCDRWEGQILGRSGIFVKELPNYFLAPDIEAKLTKDCIAVTQASIEQIEFCHERMKGMR